MAAEGKKSDEVIRDMRAEIEKATTKLRGAAHKALERPETKELLGKADKFLGALGRGADVLFHEIEGEFKELTAKLREAAKDKAESPGEPGNQDGGGI